MELKDSNLENKTINLRGYLYLKSLLVKDLLANNLNNKLKYFKIILLKYFINFNKGEHK